MLTYFEENCTVCRCGDDLLQVAYAVTSLVGMEMNILGVSHSPALLAQSPAFSGTGICNLSHGLCKLLSQEPQTSSGTYGLPD